MGKIVLEVKDVAKNFGGLKALSNLNLSVEEGTVHAIIGPNGAGKSTMLNVCIGKLIPDAGTVTFNGTVVSGGMASHKINQLGISRVFQTPEIFSELTVLQNVMISALAKLDGEFSFKPFSRLSLRTDAHDDAVQKIEELGILGQINDEAGNLSRGNKRLLELAMCLAQHPKLLLLDEPTAGMSRADTNNTLEVLHKIKESGMTKVIIEHDMHVVFSIADRISVLAQGTIIAEGTPDEIRGNPIVREAYLGGAEV